MTKLLLKKVPFFQSLDDQQLDLIAELAQTRSFPRHTLIITEGEESSSLFIVLEGKMKVFLSDESGREVILGFEGVGGYIGEIGLLDSEPRSASVMSIAKSKCLIISKDAFLECIRLNPEVAVGIILGLTKRVRSLLENVRNLALRNVYRRVVGSLLSMAVETGDCRTIEQKLTHQELADMVGASREMVNRVLRDLTAGGYITIYRHSIVIHRTPPSGW
jgi:CRP/FNR family transcriptional regulator, cyclic AMP receptor protein